MEFDFEGQVNGTSFRRVVLIGSAIKAYERKNQPPKSEVKRIFCEDILPTLSKYEVATSYDSLRSEWVMHAVSCTSGQIGFSTEHRDTIFKIVGETLYVFHHNMRSPAQYERLMNKFYPSGI